MLMTKSMFIRVFWAYLERGERKGDPRDYQNPKEKSSEEETKSVEFFLIMDPLTRTSPRLAYLKKMIKRKKKKKFCDKHALTNYMWPK